MTGKLYDNTPFEGNDTIMVRMPGDVDCNGKVDMRDTALVASRYGKPNADPYYDVNEDGKMNMQDVALVAVNFGKTYS
jgi:hypothetical protein